MRESQIYDKLEGLTEFLAENGLELRRLGFGYGISELNISLPKEARDASKVAFIMKGSDIVKEKNRYDFIDFLQNQLQERGFNLEVKLYDKSAIQEEIASLGKEDEETQRILLLPLRDLLNSSFPIDKIQKGKSLHEQFAESLELNQMIPNSVTQNLNLNQPNKLLSTSVSYLKA